MKRRVALSVCVVSVAVLAAGGLVALRHHSLEQRVRKAIVAYDLALIEALRDLDASRLEGVALPREIGRVRNYIMLLEATGTRLETEFIDLEVIEVRSREPTVTVVVAENWRETERDVASGAARGPVIERHLRIEYTLLPEDGALKVYLSQVLADSRR